MSTEGFSPPAGAEPPRPDDPRSMGGFRIVARLGEGGMGAVYLGVGPDGRQVAIKVIRRELAMDPGFRGRFNSEVAAARSVAPFCTARVLDHGQSDGRPYLITEYIPGPSLSEYVDEHGAVPTEALNALAVGIATALAAIHTARLVHRDLKPANVLLSATGPRVIDFGIARAVDSAVRHTQTGHIIGSPGWLAPEQVFEGTFSSASDVFTWGSLIAYAAMGRHPYGRGNLMVLAVRAQQGEHDLTGVPAELLPLVKAALDPDPAQRPSTERLLVSLVGEEDPLTGARHAITEGWAPSVLPHALFEAPPVFPPPPVTPPPQPWGAAHPAVQPQFPPPAPQLPHTAPPQLPHTAPPQQMPLYARPPAPPTHRSPGGGAVFGIAVSVVAVLLIAAVIGYVVLSKNSDEGPGVSASGRPTASTGAPQPRELTALPEFCKKLVPSLPKRVSGIKEEHRVSDTTMRNCKWERLTKKEALHFSVQTVLSRTGVASAQREYTSAWEYATESEYHRGRERVPGLGNEAFSSQQVSPISAGPNENNVVSYWMGGAEVYLRQNNITVEVTWTGASYSGSGGRSLKGKNIPHAQAKREAIAVARVVLQQLR